MPGEDISIPFDIPIEDISYEENMEVNIALSCSSESQYLSSKITTSNLVLNTPFLINLLTYAIVILTLVGIGFLIYFVYKKIWN